MRMCLSSEGSHSQSKRSLIEDLNGEGTFKYQIKEHSRLRRQRRRRDEVGDSINDTSRDQNEMRDSINGTSELLLSSLNTISRVKQQPELNLT